MKTLVSAIPLLLHTAALLAAAGIVPATVWPVGWILAVPAYPVVLFAAAGVMARSSMRHVRPGRFQRDPRTVVYRGRMVYGAAWTSIYYCKPLLHLAWSCPPLKALLLRAFGYRGSLGFTIYPDTWIRDLCLLDFGPGTYVANRATLGTNLVRSDGQIQVAPIRTGRNVLVGHLAMVGGGTTIGDGTEVGLAAKVGLNVRLGQRVAIGPGATVDSCARVGSDVVLGVRAHIGKGATVHEGIEIPAGAVVPDRAVIRNALDLQAILALGARLTRPA